VFEAFTRLGRPTPENAAPQLPPPPSLGLALGGGAARGWAHIGILKTLTAAGYRPQVIAGTSIGAVVGACYAVGKLQELEDWALSLTRRRVFSLLDLSLAGAGIISGKRLQGLLDQNIGDIRIEDLPVRFGAVATELWTGHEVWLTRGHLVEAIRASYALPGIFEPVSVGGRWLMDGALVNPIPVSMARAFGARVVVAVNLHADVYGRGTVIAEHGSIEADHDEVTPEPPAPKRFPGGLFRGRRDGPPGIPTTMIEAFNITQDRIARARLAGDPPDVSINPRLAPIGLFEFHRAAEAIELGTQAAEKSLESIADMCAALR